MGPSDFLIPICDEIESPEVAKHLIAIPAVARVFPDKPVKERLNMLSAYSTHPYFDQLKPNLKTCLLKTKTSASKALTALFTENEMVVDCGMATVITYYMAILKAMIARHGEEAGKERFDLIFGHVNKPVPRFRRMMLSAEGPFWSPSKYNETMYNGMNPFQPLSGMFDHIKCKNLDDLMNKVEVGSLVRFMGDSSYDDIHPAGSDRMYNCIVVQTSPLKVRTMGHKKGLTAEELYQVHMNAYNEEPSAESMHLYDAHNVQMAALYPQASRERIQGFNLVFEKLTPLAELIVDVPLEYIVDYFQKYFEKVYKNANDPQKHIQFWSSTDNLPINSLSAASVPPATDSSTTTAKLATKTPGGWWATAPKAVVEQAPPVEPAAPAVIFSAVTKSSSSTSSSNSSSSSSASSDSWFKPGALKNGF